LVLTLFGIVVSSACACASLRRIWLVADATALDPAGLARSARADGAEGLRAREPGFAALRLSIEEEPAAEWERDLFEALEHRGAARVALVNEQLAELDYRAQRWGRVPRVCASISSSTGFLLAALAMRAGLASEDVDLNDAVLVAINAVTVGIAGTAFCIAVHVRARAMMRGRLAATDKLVERLEVWADRSGPRVDERSAAARGPGGASVPVALG
jgi:hypothetical protein